MTDESPQEVCRWVSCENPAERDVEFPRRHSKAPVCTSHYYRSTAARYVAKGLMASMFVAFIYLVLTFAGVIP